MNFTHYDLGYRQGGEIVLVKLTGNAANVRLMDSSNFASYRSRQRHTYYGGHATRSPIRLQIPRPGHWHVTIDLGGYRGNVRSSIEVLPGALRSLEERPLASVPSLIQGRSEVPGLGPVDDEREFDVFISHASEDKDDIVRPLATALQGGGLKVWYDEFELRLGDSLRRKIDSGLARSRFGVVVLSRAFMNKGWTNYELDGIVTRSVNGEQVLLPIWHGITKREVIDYSPSIADKLARSTGTHTVEEIAAEIIEIIRNPGV